MTGAPGSRPNRRAHDTLYTFRRCRGSVLLPAKSEFQKREFWAPVNWLWNVGEVCPFILTLHHRLWRLLPTNQRRRMLAWASALAAPKIAETPPLAPDGVILAGEFTRASGLGESARLTMAALKNARCSRYGRSTLGRCPRIRLTCRRRSPPPPVHHPARHCCCR